MKMNIWSWVIIVLISLSMIGLVWSIQATPFAGVETRHDKLVFSAAGCKVYQVTIKNEYGFDQIYVALNPAASKRPTTAYPTCRIAH